MNNKNILEFCLSPDLGGLELFTFNCFNYLKTKTNCKLIIAPNKKLDKYIENKDKFYISRNKFFPIVPALRLAKYIDENKIDIVHFHWTKDITTVVLAKLLSKNKPKIVQTRHMTMTRFKNDFYHKFLYKHIDLIIGVTNQVKEQLEKFIPSEIRPSIKFLYAGTKKHILLNNDEVNGLKKELGFNNQSFNIGMVGRINEAKGQYLLIKAVEELVNKGLDVTAYFVGHAMEESYLEMLKLDVKKRNLEDNIYFLGFMKNPQHFYQICDAIVLASKRETFGLVLVEAMQVGTAVIGSNSGGVVEIIEDNKNGLLFNVGDENDLASKINYMINNPQKVKEMEKQAILKCEEQFCEGMQYKKLQTIFENLL